MNVNNIKKAMINDGNDMYFTYNGYNSGVSSTVVNSVFVFHAWYGSNTKEFTSFDKMINDTFFDGNSIIELVETIDIHFC